MGYNTTVVVMNDALEEIRNDFDFGENLVQGIINLKSKPIDVVARNGHHSHGGAARVISCDHADSTQVIAVGGNTGRLIDSQFHPRHKSDEEIDELILHQLADKLGYTLKSKKLPKK